MIRDHNLTSKNWLYHSRTYVESCKIFYIRKFREVFFSFFDMEKQQPWYGREGKLKRVDFQKLLKKLQWASFFLDYSIIIKDRIDRKRTKLIGALIKQWSTFKVSVFESRPLLDLLIVVVVGHFCFCEYLRTYVRTYVVVVDCGRFRKSKIFDCKWLIVLIRLKKE